MAQTGGRMPRKRQRQAGYLQAEEVRRRLAEEEAAARRRVPADPTQLVIPSNSYFCPPQFYDDVTFTCVDCGADEVWKAADQKWWYEVAKGSIYSTAILCRACRKARREAHGGMPRRSHAERRAAEDKNAVDKDDSENS
jgi:hypothetical protein